MKIVIVSDSHGEYNLLQKVYLANQKADLFLHCGDSELPEYMLNPFSSVKGNCDYQSDLKDVIEFDTPIGKLHIEHGNHIDFKNFTQYFNKLNCNIFLFGHTHKKYAYVNEEQKIYVFNPGSLTEPRDSNLGSYLILNIENNKLTYEFKEII